MKSPWYQSPVVKDYLVPSTTSSAALSNCSSVVTVTSSSDVNPGNSNTCSPGSSVKRQLIQSLDGMAASSNKSTVNPKTRRRKGCSLSLFKCSDNPLTVCILIYMAVFQYSVFRFHNYDCHIQKRIPPTRQNYQFQPLPTRRGDEDSLSVLPSKQFQHHIVPLPPTPPPEKQEMLQRVNPFFNDTAISSSATSSVWNPFSRAPLKKVLYPIFVTSLPKSGTTSVHRYFKCGKQASSHNWYSKHKKAKSELVGKCIQQNIQSGKPPFSNFGPNDVFTDTGVSSPCASIRLQKQCCSGVNAVNELRVAEFSGYVTVCPPVNVCDVGSFPFASFYFS